MLAEGDRCHLECAAAEATTRHRNPIAAFCEAVESNEILCRSITRRLCFVHKPMYERQRILDIRCHDANASRSSRIQCFRGSSEALAPTPGGRSRGTRKGSSIQGEPASRCEASCLHSGQSIAIGRSCIQMYVLAHYHHSHINSSIIDP